MTGLPPSLEPWEEQLAVFPEDVALGLGPWVQRLALGLGPLRAHSNEGLSEPDGYNGLSRRGPYERLLASEWLLASELPEEFTRRAAMREHAFLKLAYQEPAGAKRSVALFDTGPSQLGTPRIAHLAALIVLAKRAKDAGAAFGWGFLQHPNTPLVAEVTPSSVRRLLQARTAFEVGPIDADIWRERLEKESAEDVWWVGPERLSRVLKGMAESSVVVRDVLEPGERKVAVAVRARRGQETPLLLELPPDPLCTRLLRDPFEAATAPSQVTPAAPKQILYSANGRRLLTVLSDGSVAAHPIPNSPRATVGKARRFIPKKGERVVAVGWNARLIVLTWGEERGLLLHGLETKPVKPFKSDLYEPPAEDAPVSPLHFIWRDRLPFLVFLDGESALLSIAAKGPAEVQVMEPEVPAFSSGPGYLGYVTAVGDALPWEETSFVIRHTHPTPGKPPVSQVKLGTAWPSEAHVSGQLAAVLVEGEWWLVNPEGTTRLGELPASAVCDVLGGGRWGTDGLLVLDRDRRTLIHFGKEEVQVVAVASTPIAQARANPDWREVAYLTERGEVQVYSATHNAVVLRLIPGTRPGLTIDGGSP